MMVLAGLAALGTWMVLPVGASPEAYGAGIFGGSSYVMRGPGPAYSGAYARYGASATGLQGRFSSEYSQAGAVPGYGRFGGSGYGSGSLRQAGTGRGQGGPSLFEPRPLRHHHQKPKG